MKYTLSTTERINLGNFEFIEVTAGVEFGDEDAVDADRTPAEFGLNHLDVLLRAHRRRARQLLPEDDDKSFILDHPALEG